MPKLNKLICNLLPKRPFCVAKTWNRTYSVPLLNVQEPVLLKKREEKTVRMLRQFCSYMFGHQECIL